MKFFTFFVAFVLFPSLYFCKSANKSSTENNQSVVSQGEQLPSPGGVGEILFNENGEIVSNHTNELPFFQKKSENPAELFRVYIASDSYQVRQIRSSDKIRRKPDPGGDELAKEEIKRFDLLNFVDDGFVAIGLNATTGKLETIAFDRRVPRMNDLAKIIQNDASRWNYEHVSKDGLPLVTKFLISYQIRLYPHKSRDEIKQMLKKKK
ncbi:lipoprotein [Leptospira ryugenii]|uniref:Lipoprotein n=1 Tax=Leptospira ryugenii TaxID=1917863 RepID=A0A2P2DX52_9LEPT|nr:hypothetical protein [Leptospira ryugenii]GBF49219.1 lipoprotein [Leptospira ryugenii]